jgi:hypothetical protein
MAWLSCEECKKPADLSGRALLGVRVAANGNRTAIRIDEQNYIPNRN